MKRNFIIFTIRTRRDTQLVYKIETKNRFFRAISFLEVDYEEMKKYVNNLEQMYKYLQGECLIDDYYYGERNSVYFIINKTGHLHIKAKLSTIDNSDYVSMNIRIDQTEFKEIIKSLKKGLACEEQYIDTSIMDYHFDSCVCEDGDEWTD